MDHFAGLDVSAKETSICIVDDTGRIVREVRVASEPEALLQVASFVADMRALNVTPHIAQNISGRRSAIDSRTTQHPGYAVSQQTAFGWGETIGGLGRPMLRGVKKLGFKFTLTMVGCNLIRLQKLLAA